MKKILFLLPILFMLILSNFVLASGSLSISSITIPSSATVGDSFTITLSISGSQLQGDQATGSLTLPSEISCTPTSSQTITLSGGTGSTSWACSANAAGDYTNQITASVTATDSGTLSTLSDNEQTGLNVLSPASLTTSSTISSSSITTSGTSTLTVGVNNAGGQSTNYNITFSPSGITFSPNSVTTNSIDGSTLENNAITVSGSTAGTYTLTATVMGSNGQTLTASQTLTVTSSGSQDTTGPGGGGGSSGGSSSSTKVTVKRGNANITVPSIAAGKMATVSIVKTEDVAFRQINISVSNSVNNIKIIITKLAGLPASVTHEISGKVYHYIEISKTNITDSDLNKINIKFAINKTWLTNNNIDASNITLYRWVNNKWNELTTTFLSQDSSEVLYQAESPGMSYFLIGTRNGEQAAPPEAPTGAAVTCTESWQCTDWSTCTNSKQTRTCTDANSCGTTAGKPSESQSCNIGQQEFKVGNTWILYSVAGVIVIVILILLFAFKDKIIPIKTRPKNNSSNSEKS
jgi:PGF-pre-PGF domain-containing protein